MSHVDQAPHRGVVKTRRIRPAFRPERYSRTRAPRWLKLKQNLPHPWGILGLGLGLGMIIGYRIGVRL